MNFPAENPQNAVLASQWARAKVGHLMMQDMTGAQQGKMKPALKEDITGLGITYNLLTQFTSFVAVEELHITEGGAPRTIRVPVEMPQGVSYSGVFGRSGSKRGHAVAGLGLRSTAAGPMPMGGAGFGLADGRRLPAEEAGERLLKELEGKDDKGELTPAEKNEKLLPLKLEESLVKLAIAGGGQPVEVRVTLRDFSDEAIAKLEALGFKVLAKATSVKLVIGTITAGKLKELALLEVVRHVAPSES